MHACGRERRSKREEGSEDGRRGERREKGWGEKRGERSQERDDRGEVTELRNEDKRNKTVFQRIPTNVIHQPDPV